MEYLCLHEPLKRGSAGLHAAYDPTEIANDVGISTAA